LVNSTIRKLIRKQETQFTKSDQLYDFVYVTDVARAFYLIGEKGIDCHHYIIGSGKVMPLKDYITIIGHIVDNQADLGFGSISSEGVHLDEKVYDITSLKLDTGFGIQVSFEEGIRKTFEWILKNEEL